MKQIISLIILVIATCLISEGKSETIVFGVVPQQSAKKLAETWTPLLEEISRVSGKQVIFATAKDIPTFEKRLANREYDIAYMNPYHYVVYSSSGGYKSLAKQRNKSIQGVVVVHKNSPIKSLEDLQAKTMAFPAPAAFAASIIPQAVMSELGLSIIPKYVSSHDSVYLNVSRQFMPAGGGVMRTLNSAPQDVQDNLRVLWRSDKYTPHAIATVPSMPDETRDALLTALLSLNDSQKHEPLLKAIGFKGFEGANDSDWNDVRGLNIQLALPKGP